MMDFRKIIDRLQQLVSEGIITEDVAKKIYPDFVVESDDERIRKELIGIFNSALGQDFLQRKAGLDKNKVITYLEKQKEQKSKIDACGFPLRDEGESACSYLERCLSPDMRNIWYEACSEIKEKQKEQKPILFNEPYNPDDYEVVIEGNATSLKRKEQKPNISDEAIREGVSHFGITQYQIDNWLKKHINVVEQKPAEWSEDIIRRNVFPPKQEWGEEDIYITHILEYIVGKHRPDEIFKIGNKQGVSAYKICSWLNSLRSQPKQEWGKEDKKILNAIISVLKEINSQPLKRLEDWDGYIRFLESIRPQWKPSEEQMEALLWCTAHLGGADHRVLAELYEHLKKLM